MYESFVPTGDNPFPRFGHTVTHVSENKSVLFGGAIGNTGQYSITGDTFIMDIKLRKWQRLEVKGQAPSQRAVHASVAVEQLQMVVYGGATGGGGVAPDDLYFLDLRNGDDQAQWIIVPVVGTTPGRRYGHSLVYTKPYLLVFGGNTGNETVGDIWSLNVEKAPFQWHKLDTGQESPKARAYHSSALCNSGAANGMMVTFGGRAQDSSALNDTWGLRRHRDGRWDWVKAPYRSTNQQDIPKSRYQHTILFQGTLMLVIGGRTNQVGESLPFDVYDTETSDWYKFSQIQRFRHSSWVVDNQLYIHGGFDQETPSVPTEQILKIDMEKIFTSQFPNLQKSLQTVNKNNTQQQFKQNKIDINDYYALKQAQDQLQQNTIKTNNKGQKKSNQNQIRLSHQVMVFEILADDEQLQQQPQIKRISIDKLQDEPKKLGIGFQDPNMVKGSSQIEALYMLFINQLQLNTEFNLDSKFNIKKELVIRLCDETIKILETESMLLRLAPPLKIFGNVNGNFSDLMRLFQQYNQPNDEYNVGDIERISYLFLGDYVDRGKFGLETVCLLFALKLRYADQIFLLRGHHEDKKINKLQGFADECALKFNEDVNDPGSVFNKINKVFEYLSIAATVDDKILCVHGGIGNTLNYIDKLDNVTKPVEINYKPINYNQQIVLDILWSDPVYSENQQENQENLSRDIFGLGNVIKFGVQRIKKFIADNNLLYIVRSHEVAPEGFENMGGYLKTIFSSSDYCGKYQNNAAIGIVKKNYELVTKYLGQNPNKNKEKLWYNPEQMDEFIGGKQLKQRTQISDQVELTIRKRKSTPPRPRNNQI